MESIRWFTQKGPPKEFSGGMFSMPLTAKELLLELAQLYLQRLD
jgi:hypothetical protein